MSNIYVQEPPTNGKVLLITTVGDIDVELWSKEAPKACRNFVQLCLEGYYDGTIFHRLVPDFIVQGGDPTGTGCGGESVYGKPFQDEFHSRLRFVRRGLVAMANGGPHDNASQFFFTLGATPELNNKHTIFGKVGGNTIYNMLKLGEGETDHSERPIYPQKVIKTKIILNPFDDIIPRVKKSKSDTAMTASKKSDIKASKNFKLLSFGEEAEEEEREVSEVAQALRGKGKSSHDLLLGDNTLSSVPAVDISDIGGSSKLAEASAQDTEVLDREIDYRGKDVDESGAAAESVRKKLKVERDKFGHQQQPQPAVAEDDLEGSSTKSETRLAELKAEAKRLKKDLSVARSKHVAADQVSFSENPTSKQVDAKDAATASEISVFRAERRKYKEQSQKLPKKGAQREDLTLKMLAAFQAKMDSVKKLAELLPVGASDDEEKGKDAQNKDDDDDDADDFTWTQRTLKFDANEQKKVLDANVHDVDRYEIFDPRNPLTVRRREASARTMKEKH